MVKAIDPADAAVLALMPPSLREIARVSSVATALTLSARYGGRRINVRASYHELAELVGADAAMSLAHNYVGERLEIPIFRDIRSRIKANAIAAARRAGRTQAELAAEYGMTERGIRFAERRADDVSDPDQLRLFSNDLSNGD